MFVTFPGGLTANVPQQTVQTGAFGTAAYPPTLENGSLMRPISSGSANPYRTKTFGELVVFLDNGNVAGTATFDSQAAATNALENIGIALEAEDAAIILYADGTYATAS